MTRIDYWEEYILFLVVERRRKGEHKAISNMRV